MRYGKSYETIVISQPLLNQMLYKLLSEHMDIHINKTHFGMFNIEQCRVAYKFFLDYKKQNNIN